MSSRTSGDDVRGACCGGGDHQAQGNKLLLKIDWISRKKKYMQIRQILCQFLKNLINSMKFD